MKKLLILGAGTGGTILANTLSRKLDMKQWDVTVIDKAVEHLYQPGFIFLPFRLYGYENKSDVTHPAKRHLPGSVNMVNADIRLIDHAGKKVETSAGTYAYDWLILALGCHVAPEEVEGLEESMGKNAFTFYTLEGSLQLQKALEKMKKGKLALNIAEMPIKCPVAPIEFVFLADYYFNQRGIRDKIEIEFVTPLAGAFTKPQASKVLSEISESKNIKITPNFDIREVDHQKKIINSFSGDSVEYDILASVPPNLGPQVIDESGLGDGAGYALTDEKTLKHKNVDNIYVLGDNTNVPTSKAGSVAHFEAEIVEENILREINGKEPIAQFDGHSNCFIESGFHKALLFDFNYDTEPLPGTFPLPKVGPFSLLKESRLNHWGKMGFKQIYWNLLLSGHLPGDPLLPSNMSFTGKDISSLAPE
ncbi:Sulfide:quinone oxidoreductase, Type III [hydrothermal vent metagenome]|uniref:Sulfide:quinone oxidoreductase, Type III n=1 Tax=hydrothermal vent metagenome TaxID=652676 RepID=A0A3B1BJG1_9ZZZZ